MTVEQTEQEPEHGWWPHRCDYCSGRIARTGPEGAGRPPTYCSTRCQNDAKAARARDRRSPGLLGAVARAEELLDRLEQVGDGIRGELSELGSPAGLAAQIAEAEATIRDERASEVDVARAALAQQVAYRALGARPEWDEAVLAALPAELHETVRRHVEARRELRAMHTRLSPTLPAWEIVPPAPYDELLSHYREAEAEFGIPWPYLAAINLVETGTGRIRGTSVAGAQGPMQFMPATWEAYGAGGDVHDHRDAILGAARYLAANNGAQDIDHALFRYNRSQRYVRAIKLYAALIAEHPATWRGLYHWGVWYLSDAGEVYLPVGYHATEPIPAAEHLASLGR